MGKQVVIALFAQKHTVFHCNPNINSVHDFNKNKDNLTNFSTDLSCFVWNTMISRNELEVYSISASDMVYKVSYII